LLFERRGHFCTVQTCPHNAPSKPVSPEFSKAFAQKPVQITICIEHRLPLSNHLAAHLQFIRNGAANVLLHTKHELSLRRPQWRWEDKGSRWDGKSSGSDNMV
jgi:hypothetical protein